MNAWSIKAPPTPAQLKDKKSAFQHLQALYEKEQALHKQEEEDFLAALGERLRKKPED